MITAFMAGLIKLRGCQSKVPPASAYTRAKQAVVNTSLLLLKRTNTPNKTEAFETFLFLKALQGLCSKGRNGGKAASNMHGYKPS
jgi:hypothetical protein